MVCLASLGMQFGRCSCRANKIIGIVEIIGLFSRESRCFPVQKSEKNRDSRKNKINCFQRSQRLNVLVYSGPQLFDRWITLSTGKIAIQRISAGKINDAIRWIVIYLVDSIIQHSNHPDLEFRVKLYVKEKSNSDSWLVGEPATIAYQLDSAT